MIEKQRVPQANGFENNKGAKTLYQHTLQKCLHPILSGGKCFYQ